MIAKIGQRYWIAAFECDCANAGKESYGRNGLNPGPAKTARRVSGRLKDLGDLAERESQL